MKTGQLYRVALTNDARENAKPANFVFYSDHTDDVIGFITEVDKEANELEICLFVPATNLPNDSVVIEKTMIFDDVLILLDRAFNENPEMRDEWTEVIEDELSKHESMTLH